MQEQQRFADEFESQLSWQNVCDTIAEEVLGLKPGEWTPKGLIQAVREVVHERDEAKKPFLVDAEVGVCYRSQNKPGTMRVIEHHDGLVYWAYIGMDASSALIVSEKRWASYEAVRVPCSGVLDEERTKFMEDQDLIVGDPNCVRSDMTKRTRKLPVSKTREELLEEELGRLRARVTVLEAQAGCEIPTVPVQSPSDECFFRKLFIGATVIHRVDKKEAYRIIAYDMEGQPVVQNKAGGIICFIPPEDLELVHPAPVPNLDLRDEATRRAINMYTMDLLGYEVLEVQGR